MTFKPLYCLSSLPSGMQDSNLRPLDPQADFRRFRLLPPFSFVQQIVALRHCLDSSICFPRLPALSLRFSDAVATRWRFIPALPPTGEPPMPSMKLTRRTIAAIPTPDKPTVFYDTELRGFGLSVRPTGARVWICEFRAGAGGRNALKQRERLGDPESMTVEEARKEAKAMLAFVARGGDPAAERKAERAAESVCDVAER